MSQPAKKLGFSQMTQGWDQFLTYRKEMLAAFDNARKKTGAHKVAVLHGKEAEAEYRKWLRTFLPKRYGVTSGYVISQGLNDSHKAPHFDVIIYDSMESQILWVEGGPDMSDQGQSLAIPCEYVRAVIEIKSRFTKKNVTDAIAHLNKLEMLLSDVDASDAKWKTHLPENFFSSIVFFELHERDAKGIGALNAMLSGYGKRGFSGGLILRGNTHKEELSEELRFIECNEELQGIIKHIQKIRNEGLLGNGMNFSKALCEDAMLQIRIDLVWGSSYFAKHAFDIVARLNGTYEPGMVSSWHGMGSLVSGSKPKQNK